MDAVIISIGTELTTGQQIDTNSAWLAAELTELGADVVGFQTVGDEAGRIGVAVRRALDAADLVVLTGGLGPTPDDLTREGLAQAIGVPLEESPEALRQIRSFFERVQRPMPGSNVAQAMLPRGCELLSNPRGTAPGIHYCRDETHLYALPGVPTEMKVMFSQSIAPLLMALPGDQHPREIRLRCFGLSEARVGELLADLMGRDRNPLIGITASDAVLTIRVFGRGRDATETDELIRADACEIRNRLGEAIFGEGDDTLEGVVAAVLTTRGETIATAESCTGGLLAKRLTDMPGSSAYFIQGCITYSNWAKKQLLGVPEELLVKHGAVSEQVAEAMAFGCRTKAGSDFALSVTGIAGPGGGQPPDKPVGLVWCGMAHAGGVQAKRALLGEHLDRAEIRDRACKTVLNLLRLHLPRGKPG